MVQNLKMCGILPHIDDRHLVCPPRSFDLVLVDLGRPGPTLRSSQHDHRPTWPCRLPCAARFLLNGPDLLDAMLKRRCGCLMHAVTIRSLQKVRPIAVPLEKILELFMTD